MRALRFLVWYTGTLLGVGLGLIHTWEPLDPRTRWNHFVRWQDAQRRWGLR